MSRLHQDDGKPCINQKVCLATTAYDNPDHSYTFSIALSREALHQTGIETAYYLLHGNCHVDDARNRIIQEFLLSDCTDLVFIDADVSWKPEDLIKLCTYDLDVVGAVYPYKRPDKAHDMPCRMMPGAEINGGLLEVEGLPTGFLRFKRHVIEELVAECEEFDGNNGHYTMTPLLFQRTLMNGTRWGGDLHVCNMWRNIGGKIYCATEIELGHSAKITFTDSLGAFMRREGATTLRYVANKIKQDTYTSKDVQEAIKYTGNKWGATLETLAPAVGFAKLATKPIIEAGSGLSTILMAAATDQIVYCLENSEEYATKLIEMANEAGVSNIAIVECNIADRWYDFDPDEIPSDYSLAFVDGPTRKLGDRSPFIEHFTADVYIFDDADDRALREALEWEAVRINKKVHYIPPRALVIK